MIDKLLHLSIPRKWRKKGFLLGFSISLILVVLLISVLLFINFRLEKRVLAETDKEQLDELYIFHYALKIKFSRIESHITNLIKNRELHKFIIDKDASNKKYIEYIFSEIINYNTEELSPTFDQMRLLDLEGNELIRVDLGEDDKAKIATDLQNKSDRYYFKDMKKLENSEIYLSKIDLNVEYGSIEEPWNPVFRIGRAVLDSEMKRIGYLLINVQFQDIIDEINKLCVHPEDNWYMLDQNGYYLYHRDIEKTYGFMFDNKSGTGFFSEYKKIWDEFEKNGLNIYTCETTGDILYIQTFSMENETNFNVENTNEVHLVMHMPKVSLKDKFANLRRGLVTGFVLMLPILTVLGLLLGISWTKNKYYIESLEDKATHDSLTNLYNKRGITEKMNYMAQLSERLDKSMSLIYLDLNGLKKVNDTLGHDKGDILIRSISRAITGSIRDTDEAGRIGGDEFIIALFNKSSDDLLHIIYRIDSMFKKIVDEELSFNASFSYGVSLWHQGDDSIEDLIRRADKEMYIMKRKQHNRDFT